MNKPLLLLFAALAFSLPCPTQAMQNATASQQAQAESQNSRKSLQANLPEAGSALPLLSTIGAGVLLGGLVSARWNARKGE